MSGKLILYWMTLVLIVGCAATPGRSGAESGTTDIHESLSAIIAGNGFDHEIRSQRVGSREIDSLLIPIPLDSLKRRHESLEKLMREIGRISLLPEYKRLPMAIEITAQEADDRAYLVSMVTPAIGNRPNTRIITTASADASILITVGHPR